MSTKITREEREHLEKRLTELEAQIAQSTESLRNEDSRPAFCTGNNGFDDLPNFEIYANNARLRREASEIRHTLMDVEVENVSTEEIGVGSKFVATLNDLEGEIVTRKYTLFGGLFLPFSEDTEFSLVSVNSPFGKAVIAKKVNDEFSYVTPGKVVVSGIIDEIISEKEIEEQPKQFVKTTKNTRK